MSNIFKIASSGHDSNIAYSIFPRAYDHIIKNGIESNKINHLEYKGIYLENDELYTAGIYQRHYLCIRHYSKPFNFYNCQIWKEDDLFLINSDFSFLLKTIFLNGFHITFIKK